MLFSLTQLAAPSNLTVTRKIKYVSLKVDPVGTAENPLDFVMFVRYPTLADANADTNRAETFVSDDFSARDHDDLTPGTTYYYRACWVDEFGNISALAATQSIVWKAVEDTDTDQTAPNTPAGLSVGAGILEVLEDGTAQAHADVSWTAVTAGVPVKSYIVRVTQVANGKVRFFPSGSNSVSIEVKTGKAYDYQVASVNAFGKESAYSAAVRYTRAKKAGSTIPTPSGLTIAGNSKRNKIDWTDVDDDTYPDYRSTALWRNTTNITPVPGTTATYKRTNAGYYVDDNLAIGQVYYYWIAHRDKSGNFTSLAGPVNSAATALAGTDLADGAVSTAKLVDGAVIAAKIADAAVNTAKFAAGIVPVEIVGALPTSGNFDGRQVYLTTDKKLYRYNGSAFVATVPSTDLTGTLTDAQLSAISAAKITGTIVAAQIADAAISTAKFAAGIVPVEIVGALPTTGNFDGRQVYLTTDKKLYRYNSAAGAFTAAVASADLTGTLTDAQLSAISATKITGQVVAAQIADAAISTAKFAAGLKPVEVLAALPGTGNTAGRMVFLTTDNKLYRYNGSAFVATVPSTDLTGTLTDAQLAAISAVKITGQIVTAQIADDAITTAKFAAGLTPVEVVGTLPTTGNFAGRMCFLTTDSKLYRHNGSAFVASVATTDLTGTLADAQLAAISASKVAGQLTDAQLAAISAAKLTGTITTTQITDDAITTAKIAAGAVTATEIAANTITAAKIAAGTITATEIAAATITGAKIAAATIAAGNLVANTITAAQIAANTITAAQIAADTITAGQIAAGAISSSELAANAVIAGKIAAGIITATEIAAATITGAKIAADTITAANILAATITSAEIAAGTITGSNIAAGTIAATNIAANSITAGQIAAGAITTSELAAGSITASKIAVGSFSDNLIIGGDFEDTLIDMWTGAGGTLTNVADATVPGGGRALKFDRGVTDSSVSMNRIWNAYIPVEAGDTYHAEFTIKGSGASANGAYLRVLFYDGSKAAINDPASGQPYKDFYQNGAITTTYTARSNTYVIPTGVKYVLVQVYHHSTSTIQHMYVSNVTFKKMLTGSLIVNGSITAANIAAGTITSAEIAAGTVVAADIAAGTITATEIAGATITGAKIAAGTITAANIAADTITAGQIAAGAISSSELAAGAVIAGKIAAGIITAAEIAAATITGAKIAADTITAANILAATITSAEIAANTITGSNIAAATITGAKIAADTIVAGNIAAGAIGATEIAAGAIATSHLSTITLSAANAVIGNVDISNANIGTLQVQTINFPNGVVIDGKIDQTLPNAPGTPTLASLTADIDRDGTIDTGLTATWTAPASGRAPTKYRVEIWRRKGDKGTDGNNVTGYTLWKNEFSYLLSHSFKANAQYFHKVRIFAITTNDKEGTGSAYTTVGFQPIGITTATAPTTFTVTCSNGSLTVDNYETRPADYAYTELWCSRAILGNNVALASLIATFIGDFAYYQIPWNQLTQGWQYYWIRYVNKSGVRSSYYPGATAGRSVTPNYPDGSYLADSTIGTFQLVDTSVTPSKLSNTAVSSKMAAAAVGSVGSYALLKNNTAGILGADDTTAGSNSVLVHLAHGGAWDAHRLGRPPCF
jgi:hypothetical protein